MLLSGGIRGLWREHSEDPQNRQYNRPWLCAQRGWGAAIPIKFCRRDDRELPLNADGISLTLNVMVKEGIKLGMTISRD
jgi:hypothetical protein